MKKHLVLAVVVIIIIGLTGNLRAQTVNESILKTKTKSNQSNDRTAAQNPETCVVKIMSTESGCDLVFENVPVTTREAGSGMATGRRMHKPMEFSVNSENNQVTRVTSPRDAASGQASGKRTAGNPIGGLTIKGGKNPGGTQFNNLTVRNGQFSLPDNCPDGEYDLILSWSWGASNSGNSKSYAQCHFILSLMNGSCMAINTKGTGASNK
jgi:hypothetical protein